METNIKQARLRPGGEPDPSIFSSSQNSVGIQIGTAIALLVRANSEAERAQVGFRHLWGKTKRQQLIETAIVGPDELYQKITPHLELGLSLVPASVESGYFEWPIIKSLLPTSFPGVQTKRDAFLVSIDRDTLEKRLNVYFDKNINDAMVKSKYPEIMRDTARYNSAGVRSYLLDRGFLKDHIVRYYYRPFNVRWIYWEPETKLLGEKSPSYWPHIFPGNLWIEAREKQTIEEFNRGIVTNLLADNIGGGFSNSFPAYICESSSEKKSLHATTKPNLANSCKLYLEQRQSSPKDLFFHLTAILYSPKYRSTNASALRMGWPHIPLPGNAARLGKSTHLGRLLVQLLDPMQGIPGVTNGILRAELKVMAVPSSPTGRGLDNMMLTAGWGSGKGSVMPGQGRLTVRAYGSEESAAMAEGARALGANPNDLFGVLGETTCDAWLNQEAYWTNIPANVWNYKLGGYQVIKKWLSYREKGVIGRALRHDEVLYVTQMARRIAAILLIGSELDANYRAVVDDAIDWKTEFPR